MRPFILLPRACSAAAATAAAAAAAAACVSGYDPRRRRRDGGGVASTAATAASTSVGLSMKATTHIIGGGHGVSNAVSTRLETAWWLASEKRPRPSALEAIWVVRYSKTTSWRWPFHIRTHTSTCKLRRDSE